MVQDNFSYTEIARVAGYSAKLAGDSRNTHRMMHDVGSAKMMSAQRGLTGDNMSSQGARCDF